MQASCLINGACHAKGTLQPGKSCSACVPSKSTSSWSLFASSGCVTTITGTGKLGYKDGPVETAEFDYPMGLAVDNAGKIYVADKTRHRIRKISGGMVSTLAGSGVKGFVDAGVKVSQFQNPTGVAVDGTGIVYVADGGNQRIRMISGGAVSTLVGTSGSGCIDGALSSATLSLVSWIAVSKSGKIFATAVFCHKIREIYGGKVSTLAGVKTHGFQNGTGSSATFFNPQGIAVDGSGNVYVADSDNHRIRKITNAGVVSTLAGTGDQSFWNGPNATAKFNRPSAVAVDLAGKKVYVADTFNYRIRLITAGKVTTVAGDGTSAHKDGLAVLAKFGSFGGIALDKAGKVYISDTKGHRIRLLTP